MAAAIQPFVLHFGLVGLKDAERAGWDEDGYLGRSGEWRRWDRYECLYTVLLNTDESESDEEMTDQLLFDVPRRGMKFIDLPYQSDQNLKAAFSDTRLVYRITYLARELEGFEGNYRSHLV